jgi:antitoxin VapB
METMALSIKHPEADRLARQLAERTGESLTDAVLNALRERLKREQSKDDGAQVLDELRAIRKRMARYPVLDDRSPDEILGYDENGIPR